MPCIKSLVPSKGSRTHNHLDLVNKFLDSGKIIIQKKVRITKKDNPNSLAKKVLAQEHKLYQEAILKIFSL